MPLRCAYWTVTGRQAEVAVFPLTATVPTAMAGRRSSCQQYGRSRLLLGWLL